MYLCTYVCVYIYIHTHTHTHIYIYTLYTYVPRSVLIHAGLCPPCVFVNQVDSEKTAKITVPAQGFVAIHAGARKKSPPKDDDSDLSEAGLCLAMSATDLVMHSRCSFAQDPHIPQRVSSPSVFLGAALQDTVRSSLEPSKRGWWRIPRVVR